ncbi:MAG: zinc ribbon domain-containing protein [Armatimonadetes bacterium]|nr:zinc ribbon domain-containing protein [Armatimonadota bacterium]
MPERVFRNVDLDLDDLADAVVDWFVRDGFSVQDFVEGSTVFLQARKENLVTKLSFTGQALNVRLTPLARGFRVDVAAGDWLDKGVGAGVAGLAIKFINPILGVGAGMATGYGIYQQLKLPERVLEYIEWYVDEHGRPEDDAEERRPRRSARRSDDDIDREIAGLSEAKPPTAPAPTTTAAPVRGGGFCPQCGATLYQGAVFCHECGTRLGAPAAAPTPPTPPTPPAPAGSEAPRPSPDDEA